MNRDIIRQLIEWKQSTRRKPLLLMGARQVGKTYILKEFARTEYERTIYLNFEDNPGLSRLFDKSLDPLEIIKALSIDQEKEITPGNTLIIFDEVQECPRALNSLKYFNESANEYHICAAGSLLGVKLAHTKGFPVGKVNFLHLYPLSFMEFLDAINASKLKNYLLEIENLEPLVETLHQKLVEYLKIYLYVGGMPEAVAEYVAEDDLVRVRSVHDEILKAYSLDFAKHAPANQVMKINQIWESVPSQLAKENKKFIYSVIRSGARAKEFEVALQWLAEAGLIHKVFSISKPGLPISAYANLEHFKLYLVDVGLLGAMSDLSAKAILHSEQLFQEFRGSLIENFVAQELAIQSKKLYYWSSQGRAELDFIWTHENIIYPIEVKSGQSSKKQSLRVYIEKYKPELSIRCSPMNLHRTDDFLNCPLYLVGKLARLLSLS